MSLINEEMVEAAAKAVYETSRGVAERRDIRDGREYPQWESLHPLLGNAMRDSARAALLAVEPLTREREAKAWDEGYRASGGDHWWTFEPGDECEQPHRPNPYRGQA